MKNSKRTTATTIALFLVLTIAVTLVALPAANAHTPPQSYPTFAFISVTSKLIGVGQTTYVNVWLDKAPPTATGPYGDRWQNFTVKVTKPDGTSATLGPYTSDPVGFYTISFTPDKTGNYTFQFSFSGQTLAGTNLAPPMWPGGPAWGEEYVGDYFEPSKSEVVTLTVQEAPVPNYPESPLPTDYWTRPIDAQNHAWYNISGNWLREPSNFFVNYTEAPNTAHIMWTKPLTFGGLVGGQFGAVSYYTGNAYEGKFWPPVIISGILYYNQFPSSMAYDEAMGQATYYMPGVHAVDLRTGEEIWYNPNMRIDFGEIYRYDSGNQHGATAYLWEIEGSTWMCYDAWTGRWFFNITDVPFGIGVGLFAAPFAFGKDGSIQAPVLGPTSLSLWNPMTIPELTGAADIPGAALNGTAGAMWRPYNKVVNGTQGFVWSVPLPAGITGAINYVLTDSNGNLDSVLGSDFGAAGFFGFYPTTNFTVWRLSLKAGQEGRLIWKQTYSTLTTGGTMAMGAASLEAGVFTIWCSQTRQHWGFSLADGSKLWGPTSPQVSWDFTVATTNAIAYNKLFSIGMGGVLYIYDAKAGTLMDTYSLNIAYPSEAKWGGNYPIATIRIADGKIYLFTAEHSPDSPPERGTPLACVDVETGEELWSVPFYASHWATNPSIADGYLVYMNAYDNQIYCFGKGPSATTVEAPMTAVTVGDSVVIQGTVTDQSAGAKGTPAIADESMSTWMEYRYMQQPMPTNATGVPVTIDAVDPNNNFIHIGTATSDTDGLFSYAWKTPNIPGKYTIIATFEGSKSYYASYAQTAMVVTEAPAATPTPTPAAPPDTTLTIIGTGIGTGIAIIIAVAVVGLMILRKK